MGRFLRKTWAWQSIAMAELFGLIVEHAASGAMHAPRAVLNRAILKSRLVVMIVQFARSGISLEGERR
jgi:hypothetical protein